MKFNGFIAVAALVALFSVSCSTPKNVDYFQDTFNGSRTPVVSQADHMIRLRPQDKIYVLVSSKDAALAQLFTLTTPSRMANGAIRGSNGLMSQLNGGSYETTLPYTINADGNIDFPVLGEIPAMGMTREELALDIQKRLRDGSYINDAIVTVEFQNLIISVLGEVRNPGNYFIDRDNYTVLDAISAAGDLSINGVRDNVRVLRRVGHDEVTYTVNLLYADSTFNSPGYYLQQNDLVYVEPNDLMKRNTVNNANTVRSSSFWFSTGSLLLSLAVLLFK